MCLADISLDLGRNAVEDLEAEFGSNKAIFVKTDVTDYVEFEGELSLYLKTLRYIRSHFLFQMHLRKLLRLLDMLIFS